MDNFHSAIDIFSGSNQPGSNPSLCDCQPILVDEVRLGRPWNLRIQRMGKSFQQRELFTILAKKRGLRLRYWNCGSWNLWPFFGQQSTPWLWDAGIIQQTYLWSAYGQCPCTIPSAAGVLVLERRRGGLIVVWSAIHITFFCSHGILFCIAKVKSCSTNINCVESGPTDFYPGN